jgi:hypothetical protein
VESFKRRSKTKVARGAQTNNSVELLTSFDVADTTSLDTAISVLDTTISVRPKVAPTKPDLWETARLVFKKKYDEDLPQMSSVQHSCSKVGQVWTFSVTSPDKQVLSMTRRCFPSTLDDMMIQLPAADGGEVEFKKRNLAKLALLWNIICITPLKGNRFQWEDDIIEGNLKHLSTDSSGQTETLWCTTVSRDRSDVLWIHYKGKKWPHMSEVVDPSCCFLCPGRVLPFSNEFPVSCLFRNHSSRPPLSLRDSIHSFL